jgi:hypothetical protein
MRRSPRHADQQGHLNSPSHLNASAALSCLEVTLLPWAHLQVRVLLHVLHVMWQRPLTQGLQHRVLVPAVTSAAAWTPGAK